MPKIWIDNTPAIVAFVILNFTFWFFRILETKNIAGKNPNIKPKLGLKKYNGPPPDENIGTPINPNIIYIQTESIP